MMYASATGASVLVEMFPSATAPLRLVARSGSKKGISPRATRSTVSWFTSTPITLTPREASTTAVGSPI